MVVEAGEVLGRLAGRVDGDHLAGDGAFVLEPGVADGVGRNAEVASQLVAHLDGAQAALLDIKIDVVARALGLVERDLVDEEVLVALFDHAADAGDVAGQIDRGIDLGAEVGARVGNAGHGAVHGS